MRVNQSNAESKKFQIPMVVTDEVIRDLESSRRMSPGGASETVNAVW